MPKAKCKIADIHLKVNITKEEILETILKYSKRAVELETTTFVILYSGHGSYNENYKGAWRCSKNGNVIEKPEDLLIQIHEVINKIVESGYKENLEITSDSCYSGHLCLEAQKLWMKDKEDI